MMRRFAVLVVLLFVPLEARAQSVFVRQGAAGSGDGSDWTNAYTDLPSSLVRGATYYVAGGDYGEWNLDDPESGSTLITIKKATTSDHGSDTGWSDTYGTTQAWVQNIVVQYGYYTIDGQSGGGPGSWDTGFGIRVHAISTSVSLVSIRGTNWSNPPLPTNLTFRHIDFEGHGYLAPAGEPDGFNAAMSSSGTPGAGTNNLTVQYCYIHDLSYGQVAVSIAWANKVLIEYTELARNSDSDANHSDGIMLDGCNDVTIRYSKFEDVSGSGIIAIGSDITGTTINNNIVVYGCLFHDTAAFQVTSGGGGDGVFAHVISTQQESQGYQVTNSAFYNNTMVGLFEDSGVNLPVGTGNLAYNNLWANCINPSGNHDVVNTVSGTSAMDYNTYINALNYNVPKNGPNDVVLAKGDPFRDSANNDFSLAGPTTPGINLAAPFNVDMLGHTARPDGSWDRGALQYTDGSANPPSSNGSNLPTGEVTGGCACNASGSRRGEGGMGLLLAFVGWGACRRWRSHGQPQS